MFTTNLLLLLACKPCGGPLAVFLDGFDESAVVSWAEEGSSDLEECSPGTDAASFECGSEDQDTDQVLVIQVVQADLVVTETVEVAGDWTCLEPTVLTISATEDTGA